MLCVTAAIVPRVMRVMRYVVPPLVSRRTAARYARTVAGFTATGATGCFSCSHLSCSSELGHDGTALRSEMFDWGLKRPALPLRRAENAMILISDLDGTLVGHDDTNEEALHSLNQHWLTEQLPRGSVLVYNTARSLSDYRELLHSPEQAKPLLLQPDILIVAEGTEVWRWPSGGTGSPSRDEDWRAELLGTWDKELVDSLVVQFHEPELIPGFVERAELRRTILVSGDEEQSARVTAALRQRLGASYSLIDASSWVPGVRMVSILPSKAGKGHAAEHVRKTQGFPPERSMWAGDTRGDSSMLYTSQCGVIVGNATPELRADAAISILQTGRRTVYAASGNSAMGVLEGLRHHGLDHGSLDSRSNES